MPHNNGSNKRQLREKTLWRIRLGVSSAPLFLQKTTLFLQILQKLSSTVSYQINSMRSSGYITRNMQNIPFFIARNNSLKNSFFPSTIIKWNILDQNIRNESSLIVFKNSILKLIRPPASSVLTVIIVKEFNLSQGC